MMCPFHFLDELEQGFQRGALFSTPVDQAIDEEKVNSFAGDVAEYNKQVNLALKEYAKIDYHVDPESKILAKAVIKYACDFLELLIAIIKNLDASKVMNEDLEEKFHLLHGVIMNKDILINAVHVPSARDELRAFHDQSVRDGLESMLSKQLSERKNRDS
ncbi:hypothetical protein GF325_09955 [Candidatus Bathyarchaeota archaeon]|nr:hypothetical protein [Candidatus Bathyarchaeota archaeon]